MARYNYLKRDELGQPQNSIFKTDKRRLNSCSKTETDADTLGTQVVPRKLMGKKTARGWSSQPISASSLQSSSERCSQPFRHGCLGDTRTHCIGDKGNKRLDALSKAF